MNLTMIFGLNPRRTLKPRKTVIPKNMNNHKTHRSFLESLFFPQLDEGSLFTMSYICILLFAVNNPPSQWDFSKFKFNNETFKGLLIFIPFMAGMVLCIFHAFSDREKTNIEKKLMLVFASIINGFTGIWVGTYLIVNNIYTWYSIFPIWNIISGYMLLGAIRAQNLEETVISSENVKLSQLVISTVLSTILFYVCYFVFKLNWAATFSICIAWVSGFYKSANSLFLRDKIKTLQV